MIHDARSSPPSVATSLVLTTALLALGLFPLPEGWARSARDSIRSPEMNRADREANAGGYYEGLIGGGGGPEGARGELALRLLGKPTDWVRFQDAGVARVLPADFLQFELRPNQNRSLFGRPFTTNAYGMRDRHYTLEKSPGLFRIALVGSSIDMGWGVGTEETYENLLEDWLNTHAAKRGSIRRFEVLNFAVAAYGPPQRLESLRRKAMAFQPDMVLYSATMLDLRLLEIHLCGLLQSRLDLHFDFLEKAVANAALTPDDLRLDARRELLHKEAVKAKLSSHYWPIVDASLENLAADCRSAGLPLVCLIIPRAGKADAPSIRADAVARHRAIAAHHAIPVIDLAGTFDDKDAATIEIAAWDDHPNALGHKLLFRGLARALVENHNFYRTLFGADTDR
ncbi:MAG TPA: SGNH/GDSL hydrolase family protein [Isosphaeraceae bacterium]|jgi:hypothetical protein|nr:SGNH/GDSL hydrolase family protein [Isosphaeraceae bacterium]